MHHWATLPVERILAKQTVRVGYFILIYYDYHGEARVSHLALLLIRWTEVLLVYSAVRTASRS